MGFKIILVGDCGGIVNTSHPFRISWLTGKKKVVNSHIPVMIARKSSADPLTLHTPQAIIFFFVPSVHPSVENPLINAA